MMQSRIISRSIAQASRSISRSFNASCLLRQSRSAATSLNHRLSSPLFTSQFSTSRILRDTESQVNAELSAKLESELSIEKEMRDPDQMPEHLKEFLENTPFKIQDAADSEEVVLTRTFGDEKIKVVFSIEDLNNVDEDPDQLHDSAIEDEFDTGASDIPSDTQSGGATSKGAINQGRTSGGNFKVAPEDSIAESDNPEAMEGQPSGDDGASFASRLYVTVEKSGKGALQIDAIAQDGLIVVDNVYFYKDAKLADPKTPTEERAAEKAYPGPPFNSLDEDLQVLFENYLSERGINTTMALFVPEYIDFKEQREYISWLQGVKNFVDA